MKETQWSEAKYAEANLRDRQRQSRHAGLVVCLIRRMLPALVTVLLWPAAGALAHDSHSQLQSNSGLDRDSTAAQTRGYPESDSGRETINFTLTTDRGEWQLSSLRGKVVFLVFGYTHCPDVCPTSLQILADAFDQLEPNYRDQARGVFVSLDPVRDDHARLRDYARYFHPNILGVTGTPEQLKQLAAELGVRFKIRNTEQDGYSIDHSTLAFAIDPKGRRLMVLVSHAAPASFVAQLVRDTLDPLDMAEESGS